MVKIIYLITKGNWGGAQRYVYDLATNLPSRGYEVAVAVGEGEELPRRLREKGVRIIKLDGLGRDVNLAQDWRNFLRLRKIFRSERPDIIHLNSSKVALIGALAGRLTKVPKIIFTAHGWAFNEDRRRSARVGIKLLHWLTLLACHEVIAVSKKTGEQVRGWPRVQEKVTVIHNGLSKPKFKTKTDARQSLLGTQAESRNGIWLGTIAELHSNKGLNYLIEALAIPRINLRGTLARPTTLVIIGEGEERKRLEILVKARGLEQTIFFVGEKTDASELLPAFDIFILPSITEAFPYVVLEAGWASLPVLATDVGGIPEVITAMKTGVLIKSHQPLEIALALKFLLQDKLKRSRLGLKLRLRIKQHFSLKQMLDQTISLYSSSTKPHR